MGTENLRELAAQKRQDEATERLAQYIERKGVKVSRIAEETGLPVMALYRSLSGGKRKRPLLAGEFLAVCSFLEVNPMQFMETKKAADG